MKRTIRLFALLLCLSALLSSCSTYSLSTRENTETENTAQTGTAPQVTQETEEKKIPAAPEATAGDLAQLNALYAGRNAYFGDVHCHPKAGVANDGKKTLNEWKAKMIEEKLDFVAFMNHKQAAHMYEEDWDDTLFIGGTEPGTHISGTTATDDSVHYNMYFPDPSDLLEILAEFPEYKYTGGKNGIEYNKGTFSYPRFTKARFQELIQAVKSKGGLFTNVHPKQQMQSNNPLDYYFADYTGLEVFYGYSGSIADDDTKDNYKLWTDLLAKGKRLWATAGSDSHGDATDVALTCIYSEEKKDDVYLSHLATGDFVCGFVGIRMAIGDAKMGSSTDFNGKRLVVTVDDFHPAMYKEGRTYTVNILTDKGVVYTGTTDGKSAVSYAIDADEGAAFYRVEVLDERRVNQPIISIGNPIWND